jgi:murein DD-endopeptidase MepM/ murein hydrolase activator NlpD
MYASLLILITFIVLASLIVFTPVKYYLPGYNDSGNRSALIQESMMVDSLLQQMQLQGSYLKVVKSIITGDIHPDSLKSLDSIALKERAQILMEKSENEKDFVEEYENAEKYNLSSLSTKENENIFVFYKPVSGVVSSSFDPEENQFGISILTAPNETVASVLTGTVIYTAFTFDFGWVIQVQHDENYMSVYKNNTLLLKKQGDKVRAGEAIAFTGEDSSKKNRNQFFFELWKQGKPVNPEEVIVF